MVDESLIKYDLVKTWLRQGDLGDLAKKHDISMSLAYKVIKGKIKNFDFMEAVLERALENKIRFDKLTEQFLNNVHPNPYHGNNNNNE